ncbi:uncharacterized protein LOC129581439 isoform X2 [Paramacrobiotus metropolitanus]|uniref:uncharacterized protein LOC129581439 isoform X2 n=1 Tax=Paramacrobiotus metropolitanus TaxID=2943436 RepID=UPI002445E462|nr:uncharacterized protein LOC129581439 isoform X2 [Paramacrobiotus metropolitanus]
MDSLPKPTAMQKLRPYKQKFHPHFTLDLQAAIAQLKEKAEREEERKQQVIGSAEPMTASLNTWYFASYEHPEAHRTMVNDAVRTGTFAMAFGRNYHLFKDKTVLDVGAGSGILSVLAIKEGGAKHAYAVDACGFIHEAELLVRNNKMEDKITVIHKRIEDLQEFPDGTKEVDVIVSEWMGHALFKESMLDSVIVARQRFLRSGGFILPDVFVLKVAGSASARHPALNPANAEKLANLMREAMDQVDLSFLLEADVSFATNRTASFKKIITDHAELKTVDMYYIQQDEVKVDADFRIVAPAHATFCSFVFYFDAFFDLPNGWCFSTGPQSRPTHWMQTVASLPAHEQFEVWRDTVISGHIRMERIPALTRFWSIAIDYTVTWKKRAPLNRSRTFYLL